MGGVATSNWLVPGNRGKDHRIRARRRGDGGLSWAIRAPRGADADAEQEIAIVADYRYRKDGSWYGGRFRFSLPVLLHRHR